MYRPRDKQTREKHVISVNDRLWLIGDLARLSFNESRGRHGGSIDRDSPYIYRSPIGRIEVDRSR